VSETAKDLVGSAGSALMQGRLPEAERLAKEALRFEPENVQAHLLVGVVAGNLNRNEEALGHFKKVWEADPNSYEALFWLSTIHRRQSEHGLALEFAERALRLRPEDAHSHNSIGLCYMDLMRLEDAAKHLKRAADIRQDMPQIFHNLGTVLHMLGRDVEAAQAFDKSLMLSPRSGEGWMSLAQVLISLTNHEMALECAKRAISLEPNSGLAHLVTASALVECGLTGQAEKHLERAVQLDPKEARALALLGQRRQSLGRFEEANKYLLEAMDIDPKQGFPYFAYAHNNKIAENDRPLVEKMEEIVADGGLAPRQLNFFYYGLGRSYESLGEYEKAMHYFDEANSLANKIKFGEARFDRDAHRKRFDLLVQTFTKTLLETNTVDANPSGVPIVIVGMMRSGTTLCEQMLSSHSQVGASGENRFWPIKRSEWYGKNGDMFKPSRMPKFAKLYIEALRKVVPDAPHITDKMPANYEYLGPIHLALPNARLIHMRRNPVDTCISIYATPNRVAVEYAYDRGNIVFAYEQYLRLMEHWRAVLPADRFLEVNYEDLVADRETQLRRMLDFMGLEWEEAVMQHQENQRNVNTPSLWQVRQPIYKTSVERWRHYEPWLGEFEKLLMLS
jgi:tetratricopeptide (TPR) repeat protein